MRRKKSKNTTGEEEISVYETSRIFKDGAIAEMIYIPEEQKTAFLVSKNGKVKEHPSIILDEYEDEGVKVKVVLKPFSPFANDLVKKQFVKFPSGRMEATDNKEFAVGPEYKSELELFERVKKFINAYVDIPDDFSTIASVYVMMSWLYDKFQTMPYLRVIGTFGTGKSRFLATVGNICYKPLLAGGSISMAALYRTINDINGTFVFDEADFKSSDMSSEIVKILNSGHTVGMPVLRMEALPNNKKFITRAFNVFGPKLLGSRERFDDQALESRCLTQIMFPVEGVSVPVHLPSSFEAEATNLRNQLLTFRFKFYDIIKEDESTLPKIKDNRLKQCALALTTIASIVDKKVLRQVHGFLKLYAEDLEYDSVSDPKADVLMCIIKMLESKGFTKIQKLKIGDIARRFDIGFYDDYSNREDRPTKLKDENGNPLVTASYIVSPRQIGSYIKKLNLKTRRDNDGYYIPILEEYPKIKVLARRFGFDRLVEIPDELISVAKQEKEREEHVANVNKQNEDKYSGDSSDDFANEEYDGPFSENQSESGHEDESKIVMEDVNAK